MGDSMLKVGVIGIGAIGKVHLDAYAAFPDRARIVAVCDPLKDRADEAAGKYGAKSFTDYRDLLSCDVDAVSVCVPNALHREIAVASLKAGKHVLLEKPMALNAKEASEIVATAKASGRNLQMGMPFRQLPEAQCVRSLVAAGELGDIYHMRVVMIRRRGVPGLGGWFTTKAMSGGGPLIDIGVHFFDVAMYLSGLWNPTSVSAMTYAKFGVRMKDYVYTDMWAGPPNYSGVCDVEDYATGLVRFGKKATMSFEVSWAANIRSESFCDICGDKAGVRTGMDGSLVILTEYQRKVADICPQLPKGRNRFHAQAENFIAACVGQAKPAATGEEGLICMKLIDAVYASAESGREVPIS